MNQSIVETRKSLLLRLSNKSDIEAWDQFLEIYQPLVFRLARSKGFQDADAQDVVQEVLLAVSKAIDRWKPDPSKGRFRDWLFCIARNIMINYVTRRRYRSISQGDFDLEQLMAPVGQGIDGLDASREFDLEYRREVFCLAADRVRLSVHSKTWEAFQRTSIELQPIPSVARQLDMTEGAVLVARCRVLAKLRKMVSQLDSGGEG